MTFEAPYITYVLGILAAILYFANKYFTRNWDYWRKRNVPGPVPKIIIGNLWNILTLKTPWGCFLKEIYDSYDTPYVGFFTFDDPALVIRDPEIVKQILVQDFNYFQNRVICAPSHNELIRSLPFFQPTPGWKPARDKLTPVFSSGKMKNIFNIMNIVGEEMIRYMKTVSPEQEAKQLLLRYSTELVTQAFYGVRSQCFERDDAEFYLQAQSLFGFSLRNAFVQTIYFFKGNIVPLFKMDFFSQGAQNFFRDVFWKCLKNVEGKEENRHNLIAILGDLKKKDSFFDGDRLVAQGMIFFTAGTETTSTTISLTLYELCMNPGLQNKLRSEIMEIIEKKGFNYDSFKEMKYLDMCVKETLRKYPALPFLDRKCNTDYKVPGTDLVIQKNLPVYISLLGFQNDKKYFPNPDKYIPERFEKNVNVNQLINFPFGFGPRNCIGERFAKQGTKMALVHILTNFSIERTRETPNYIEIDPKCVTIAVKGGLLLKFKKLKSSPIIDCPDI